MTERDLVFPSVEIPTPKVEPKTPRTGICSCCKRFDRLTLHHITPQSLCRRKRKKKKRFRQRGTCEICENCHVEIHRLFDNHALALTPWKDTVAVVMRNIRLTSERDAGTVASAG